LDNPYRKKEINGREYALLPMAPMLALDFAPKVIKAVVGSLGRVDLTSLDSVKIMRVIGNLDSDTVTDLLKLVFKTTIKTAEGKTLADTPTFDHHFTQYPADMIQVGLWAIWENSKDFLLENVENFQSLLAAGAGSQSQKIGETTT